MLTLLYYRSVREKQEKHYFPTLVIYSVYIYIYKKAVLNCVSEENGIVLCDFTGKKQNENTLILKNTKSFLAHIVQNDRHFCIFRWTLIHQEHHHHDLYHQ